MSLVAARSPLFIEMGLADDAVDELRSGPLLVLLLLIRDDCPIGIPDLLPIKENFGRGLCYSSERALND